MLNPLLIKTFTAGGAIGAYKAVKFSADNTVVLAAAETDIVIGVTGALATASGAQCDVTMIGIAEIEYGDTVTRGAHLVADADGNAVVAAPAATETNETIGRALIAGADGDIGYVLLNFGSVSNAANS